MTKQDKIEERIYLESFASVKPVFCCECGTKMYPEKVVDSQICGKYDKNGHRQYLIVFKCPNSRWYHLGFRHEKLVRLVREKQQ